MKAKERHELHKNDLAEWLEGSMESVAPYARAITAAIVAAAILVGVYFYVTASARRASVAAADQLLAALRSGGAMQELQTTINEHRGSQPALIAQLLFAEQELSRGENMLFVNKSAAREGIVQVGDQFAATYNATRDPMLRAWAKFGMGRAFEALGELDRAREEYQIIVREDPNGALAKEAQQHLDELDRQSTKEFYDWFAKQDPRPAPPQSAPGTPGLKPSFDLQDPAQPGEVKLPSSLEPGSPTSGPASGPSMPTGEAPVPGEK